MPRDRAQQPPSSVFVVNPSSNGGGAGGGDASAANQTTAITKLTSIDGKLPTVGQKTMAASRPVVIASDQSALPVSMAGQTPDVTDRAARLLGHVTVDNFPATQPVSIASAVTTSPPANASTNVAQMGGTAVSMNTGVRDAGTQRVTIATNDAVPVTGAFFQATQPVSLAANTPDVTDRAARLLGHVQVDNFPATQPVSIAAAVSTTPPANASTNISQLNGTTIATGTGVRSAGTQRVTVATDDLVPVSLATLPALVAGAARIGKVQLLDSADVDLTAAKGSQTARAMGTQDLKDAGRTSVALYGEAIAGAIAEALVSMGITKGLVAQTAGTSYNVTAGKTLRLTALTIAFIATTTTANTTRIRIRANPSGAAVIGSPVVFTMRLGWESSTFIANEAATITIPIPDGLEIPGGGGVAITHVEAAANGTVDVCLNGFEY